MPHPCPLSLRERGTIPVDNKKAGLTRPSRAAKTNTAVVSQVFTPYNWLGRRVKRGGCWWWDSNPQGRKAGDLRDHRVYQFRHTSTTSGCERARAQLIAHGRDPGMGAPNFHFLSLNRQGACHPEPTAPVETTQCGTNLVREAKDLRVRPVEGVMLSTGHGAVLG